MPTSVKIVRGFREHVAVLFTGGAGPKRIWPRMKTQYDIEQCLVAHEGEGIHIAEISLAPADYDAYMANRFKGERIVLSGNGGPATQYLWREQVDRTGHREPHIFPAEVHATPPPPARCDDCGAGDQSLISKGDHHGGTKIVCADRAACHARGG
jgi:hypothetical protein